jgi:hypothetical protein
MSDNGNTDSDEERTQIPGSSKRKKGGQFWLTFEVLMAAKIPTVVVWVVTKCGQDHDR